MGIKNRKFLLYCSFTMEGVEKLVDYTITAPSRGKAKYRAMNRMIIAGGENRHIDGCHLMDEEFKRREASFSSDGGRGRAGKE